MQELLGPKHAETTDVVVKRKIVGLRKGGLLFSCLKLMLKGKLSYDGTGSF